MLNFKILNKSRAIAYIVELSAYSTNICQIRTPITGADVNEKQDGPWNISLRDSVLKD